MYRLRMTLAVLATIGTVCALGQSPAARWHDGVRVSPLSVGQTVNSATFGGFVDFGGQPAAEDFARYAARGVKTVINLRTAVEMERLGFDEKAVVEKAGMNYVHVPVGGEPPAPAEMAKILAVLEQAGERRVLLHCASSVRSGFVWSVFRATRHRLGVEEAIGEGKAAGLASPRMEKHARDVIAAQAGSQPPP